MKIRGKLSPIIIKHSVKGRVVSTIQVRGTKCAIGSSLENKIQLHSKELAGVCCFLENSEAGWTIYDLGSQPDVKLNGKSFLEHEISELTALEIGDHRLELTPAPKRRTLFAGDVDEKKSRKLMVVKINGHVFTTTTDKAEVAELKKVGKDYLSFQEVFVPKEAHYKPDTIKIEPDLKKSFAGTILALFLFFVILLGLPIHKGEDLKPQDDVYTKMIFDSKVLAQKKKQLVSYGKETPKGTGAGNGSISEGTKGNQSNAMKAVASLRKAGVSSIINKIALRAASSAKLIAAFAATPEASAAIDNHGTMPSMPSAGATLGKVGIIGNGKGYAVGGIGTGAKGGGTGGYKAGTGLGTGSTGNGEVGLEDTESVVEGGLDREVIAAVIRDHLGQVRYCYERQLAASPDLYGKLKVRFTIDANGEVDSQSVSQTTLKNSLIEDCILRRIATWKFPKPKGGTKVIVSYPFLFKSVN
jgi:hypothetical protein